MFGVNLEVGSKNARDIGELITIGGGKDTIFINISLFKDGKVRNNKLVRIARALRMTNVFKSLEEGSGDEPLSRINDTTNVVKFRWFVCIEMSGVFADKQYPRKHEN